MLVQNLRRGRLLILALAMCLTVQEANASSETACQNAIQSALEQRTVNRYSGQTEQTKVQFGMVLPHSREVFFGGHPYLAISAQLQTFKNGNLFDIESLPMMYCVLDEDGDVLGLETDLSQ